MFKVLNRFTPDIMNEIFPQYIPTNYNLRNHWKFSARTVTTVHYGTESIWVFSRDFPTARIQTFYSRITVLVKGKT